MHFQKYWRFFFYSKLFILYRSRAVSFRLNSTGTQPYIHMYPFSPTPLPSRLPRDIKQSSLCCTVGPFWLFILNLAMYTCPSQLSNHPLLPSFHLATISSFSRSVSLLLFCKYHLFLDSTCKGHHTIFLLLWLHSVWHTPAPSMLLQMALFHSF